MDHYTFNSLFICSSVSHHQGSCLPIQWVRRIRIQEKLWEKHFKHICQVCGNCFETSYITKKEVGGKTIEISKSNHCSYPITKHGTPGLVDNI